METCPIISNEDAKRKVASWMPYVNLRGLFFFFPPLFGGFLAFFSPEKKESYSLLISLQCNIQLEYEY